MIQPPALSGTTQLVAVLGDPVRHSLSPAMHNAAIRALGLDWVYLALPVSAARLAVVVEALEAIGCCGLNVTIPHKQAVARLCRQLSPLAERVGAVNTLVPLEQGGWQGTNTDVEGFLAPLRERDWRGSQALVLGCGGSARAVVAGLVELGLERVTVAGRRRDSLEGFSRQCAGWAPPLRTLDWSEHAGDAATALTAAIATAQLLVNTTPVGMASRTDPAAAGRCPLPPAALAALPAGCWVYDLVYTPRPTALLQAAAARGCLPIDGLEMLVQQGAAALRLWTAGARPPVAAMRAAALEHLGACP